MSNLAIHTEELKKSFGATQAVGGVGFDVKVGSVCALLGRNGAGKTTTVRILTTLLRADSGHATVAGYDIARSAATVRQLIGVTGQSATMDELLTGRENLEIIGRFCRLTAAAARQRATELLEQFELTEAAGKRVRHYSGGMRRRLDLGASLIAHPQVLFLDEPTTGLDPVSRRETWTSIRSLVAGGTTVLLTTQYLDEADQLADTVVVVDHGIIVARGTPEQLKASIGRARIRVTLPVPDPAIVDQVCELLGEGAMVQGRSVSVPAPEGLGSLEEMVRRLRGASILVHEVGLDHPTLDEVFSAVTTGDNPSTIPVAAHGSQG